MAVHADAGAGRQADEGVAPEALATLHRLQQIGERLVGELEIHRQRRIEVRQQLLHQRDAVVALLGEFVEFLFSHDLPRR
jgi:hypothetical protein